jgi:hypothetical protein
MPNSQSRFPVYLTSGASSRAHHALLAKLHDVSTAQEEDSILLAEIRRIRDLINSKSVQTVSYLYITSITQTKYNPADQSTITQSKLAECLIILLHCYMMGSKGVMDRVKEDWALMVGLRVAEGGSNLKERRIGESLFVP